MNSFDMPAPTHHRRAESHGKNRVLTILWAELEYDVKYDLYKRSQFTKSSGEDLKAFKITDKDQDWLLRTFNTAVENFKMKLRPYLVDRSIAPSNELMDVPTEYNIELRFEDGWRGTASSLLNCAHNYIVNYTLGEWLMKAGSELSATYKNIANTYANEAYNIANDFDLEHYPIFIL